MLQRRGDEAAGLYPGVAIVREFEGLLDATARIDLIVVATPHPTHVPYALQALEAGKHVVVEKPFAVSLEEGRRVAAAARAVAKVVAPFHNRRWDGDFQTVRALLARGWLGDLRSFESRFDRWRPAIRPEPWKEQPFTGSGLLFDIGPHLIDQAVVLFGVPRAVSGSIAIERQGSLVDDHFEVVLDYDGFQAHLGATVLASVPGPRFHLAGAHGDYTKHGLDPQEDALRRGTRPGGPDWGLEPPDRWGALAATIDGLHVTGRLRTLPGNYGGFYDNVCDAIAGTEPLAVTPDAACDTLRIIEMAHDSSRRAGARIAFGSA